MKKSTLSVRDMALCAMGAGFLAISAWISVPVFDIAFTMQTFACVFLLEILGGRLGTMSYLVYLGLGMVGLPVFSGFRGGLGALLGVTGGYIWGLLASCLIYWCLTAWAGRKRSLRAIAVILGLPVCYGLGSLWFLAAYTGGETLNFWAVTAKCVAPYVLPDILKILLAFSLSERLRPGVRL